MPGHWDKIFSSAEALTRQLLTKVKPSLVFDGGGNEGQFAHDALSSPGQHKVVSFEPFSEAHALMEAKDNARWQIAPSCDIGDDKGSSTTNISGFSNASSLGGMNDINLKAAPEMAYCGQETVDVFRLDDIGKSDIKSEVRATSSLTTASI